MADFNQWNSNRYYIVSLNTNPTPSAKSKSAFCQNILNSLINVVSRKKEKAEERTRALAFQKYKSDMSFVVLNLFLPYV